MITKTDKEAILDRAKIEEVVQDFIPDLIRERSRYKCCCPVHSERTPSFIVDPGRNTYHCFSCHVHGDAISFLVDIQGMSFPEACRYLAKKYSIDIKEEWKPQTDEEKELADMKESILAANKAAMKFYASRISAKDDHAKFAYEYAVKRWGENWVKSEDIGFAPGRGELMAHLESKGFSREIMIKAGLAGVSEKTGKPYDALWDRVVIPIRKSTGEVIGFTARTLTGDGNKYVNTKDTPVYSKSKSLFGIHNAKRHAKSKEVMYLVEGGPDVMKLQSLGIYNTVAPLGTAWTPELFSQLRRIGGRLCFIPDKDPPKNGERHGAGINAVIRNGIAAVKEGFSVTVKEIPDGEGKQDPDSYINSVSDLDQLEELDFIPWYAGKIYDPEATTSEKSASIKNVAELLSSIDDTLSLKMLSAKVAKVFEIPVSILNGTVNAVTHGGGDKKKKGQDKVIDQALYQKYGFFERGNRYMALGNDAQECEWSNFVMRPLIHVKDPISSKRLFKMINDCNQEAIIEMKQEDLVSLQRFKIRTENEGNFRWKAKEAQLDLLKGLLYEAVRPANEITQLGWQRKEFFAFGNGVLDCGRWIEPDQYGIVDIPEKGCYYLPSSSVLYANERGLFQFERRFIHLPSSNAISLREYSDLLYTVFGDNSRIGIGYYLATLFKDVVVNHTEKFPILNLFGEKGSGKSSFGEFLMSFFVPRNKGTNLTQTTVAGLAALLAQVSNVLVHIDEYKNSIDLERREMLKMIYDGVGRSRMNMDRDKKKEMTAVDCGVILSGQEMPTIDIAILARTIFLTFNKTTFSPEEKAGFDRLSALRDSGCTHITVQLLKHRVKFEEEFKGCYASAWSDIIEATAGTPVEDRILRNWAIPLAAFRTLEGVIDLGFDYRQMLEICVDGILRQNGECKSSNETAGFWRTVDFLHQNGDIFNESDYRIVYETEFKPKGAAHSIRFKAPKKILYLCTKRVFMLYKIKGKQADDCTVPVSSLRHYLEHSTSYLGIKPAVRFKNLSNDKEALGTYTSASGQTSVKRTSRVDWAMAFDYEELAKAFEINLEVSTEADDEPDITNIDITDKQTPY